MHSIWQAWFDDSFLGISWAHAHIPGIHEPLGHWNSNVNTQILEEFPAGIPLEGTGMGTGPRGTCAEHHQRRAEKGGRDTASPHEPIPPPLTLRSGREGHRAFRETWPAHWTLHTTLREWNRHEELRWHILLIDLRVTTVDFSTLPKAK